MTSLDAGADGELAEHASYADLYENAPCGQLSTTPDGTILQVNRTLLAWTGFDRGTVLGSRFHDLLITASQLFYETRALPVLRLEGEVREIALTMRRADGTTLAVLLNSTVVKDAVGRPSEIRTAIFDSTSRRDYERALLDARRQAESSEERVRVLQTASIAFGAATTEAAVAEALVASARTAFAAGSVAVLLATESGALDLLAGSVPIMRRKRAGDRIAPVGGPGSDALRSGNVVALADGEAIARLYPHLSNELREAHVEAITATPLMADGTGMGIFVCYFERARKISPDLLELHEALGRQAADAFIRIRLQRRLERMALHDPLTGLPNRELLIQRLDEVLGVGRRNEHPTAVLFIDLDGFKPVNDQLGHAVGDVVLQEVATRLRGAVRQYDTTGRIGGDEFIVVCEDADEEDARAVADRVRSAIGTPFEGVPEEFVVTASVGVAVHRPGHLIEAMTPHRILEIADSAMYESKRSGRDLTTVVTA